VKRVLTLICVLLAIGLYPAKYLVIVDEAGQTVFRARVVTNEQVVIKYIHSVERTPWHHYYRIGADNRLHLTHMRFKSFGAGVPHYSPVVRHVGGWIEYSGLDQRFENLTWHVRADLDHYLTWRGADFRLGTLVRRGNSARMFVAYRPIILLLMPMVGGFE